MDDTSYLDDGYDSVSQIASFFHASPHRFEVGALLVPQPPARRNFACSCGFVYLTDAPAAHHCIAVIAREDGWFVYRVQPLSQVRPGIAQDLVCESAQVLECLGPASGFQGDSCVTMSSRYHELQGGSEKAGKPSWSRVELAERAIGAIVAFKSAGAKTRRKGRIVFADYNTLNVLVDIGGDEGQRLVSLRDCTVLSLRGTSVPVLHGARLDVWQHGEGWRGVGIADERVANSRLEPLLAVAA